METLSQEFLNELITKFGDKIDIKSQSAIIAEILQLAKNNPNIYERFENPEVTKGYDKSYTRDYDKDAYDKTYQQYDKTIDADKLTKELRPDIEKLIKEHLSNISKGK